MLILCVPAASAGSAPVVGFLADVDGPAAPGHLQLAMPEGNESSSRPIVMDLVGSAAVFHADPEAKAGTHLKGPVFAALWIDLSAVAGGSLQLQLKEGDVVLAEHAVDVSVDPESLPEPESLVPPDPMDPEGAIWHVAAQVLPAVTMPPLVFDLGIVDAEVSDNVHVELRLLPPAEDPLAVGSSIISYDGALAPSYVYLPWWSADPAAQPPQQTIFQGGSGSGSDPGGSGSPGGSGDPGSDGSDGASGDGDPGADGGSGGSKGIPAPGLVPLALVMAALLWRRR